MKNLNELLNEKLTLNRQSKTGEIPEFELSEDERDDFLSILGYITGYYGGGPEQTYKVIWDKCTKKEEDMIIDLYSLFNNQEDFPKITNKILSKDEALFINELCIKLQNSNINLDDYEYSISNIQLKIEEGM